MLGSHGVRQCQERHVTGSDYFTFIPARQSGLIEVRLYAETILKVVHSHPEIPAGLPSMVEAIKAAVASPTQIEMSYGNSYVFVDHGSANRSGDPLVVAIKRISATSGRVRTFYFAQRPAKADVLWRLSYD